MQRIYIIIILTFFLTATIFPNEKKEEYIIVYDVFKHKETMSHIYLGISGLSLGIGSLLMANSNNNQFLFGLAIQNILWGLCEAGIYIYDKNWGYKETDPEKARQEIITTLSRNLIFDIAAIITGGILLGIGDNFLKGHGTGILIQGMILAIYDFSNFFIASNPETVSTKGID